MAPETLSNRLGKEFEALTPPKPGAPADLWVARKNQADVAVHVLGDPCPINVQTRLRRYQRFLELDWPFLPRLETAFAEAGYLVVVEEWVHGRPWSAVAAQNDRARRAGAELFDILAEIHSAGLTVGALSSDRLILDKSTDRLKLLGVVTRPEAADDSPSRDLEAALRLLEPYLQPEERAECAACPTAAQVSRLLRRSSGPRCDGEPLFVGRQQALDQLSEARAESHLLILEAPAGGGKTRLLREWTRTLKDRLLWAKADRHIAPSPFQMFSGPISDLEKELAHRPDLVSLLVHELGVELPLMQSLSGSRKQSPGLQRGLLVMLSLMLMVVGRDRPTVLVLDDCQWADPLTLRFLEYWAENGQALLVIATFRDQDLTPEHPLRAPGAKTLRLPPLAADHAHQLLLSYQPQASLTLRESAIRQAAGNPFSLLSFVRGGKIEGDSHLQGYAALPESLRAALAVASVLGREFRQSVVEGCLGRKVDWSEAQSEGLLEASGQGYRFVHDRIRDLVLSTQHTDEISAHHLLAARFLARDPDGNPFDVAFHFQAAGTVQEGFPHAIEAGRLALQRNDSGTAVFYLKAALDGAEGQPAATVQELLGKLGDCHRLTGQYDGALDCFTRAYRLASTDPARARLMLRIGDVHFKRGELEQARTSIERGLALLGERLPRLPLADFLKQALIQAAHTYLPARFVGRQIATKESTDLLRVDLYNRLAYIRWFLEGPVPSICAHLRELNLAERYAPTRSLARAYASHAIAMGAFPLWTRSLRFGASALRTAGSLGDDWGAGQAGHFYGAALLGASRLAQSREQLELSVKKLQQTGDRWEENGARYHLAISYYRMGDLDAAADLARETQAIGVSLNDRLAAGDNLFTWARATGGLLPRSALELEKRHQNPDIQRACELLGAEALLEFRERRYRLASQLLVQAIALYASRRAQSMYSAPLPCWLATASRLDLQSQGHNGKVDLSALKPAQAALKHALRLAHSYRNNLPHAYREQSLLLDLQGDPAARDHLARSVQVAQELGMIGELEAGHRLASQRGWPMATGSIKVPITDRHDWMLWP